jgi:hypothetical protein
MAVMAMVMVIHIITTDIIMLLQDIMEVADIGVMTDIITETILIITMIMESLLL